MNFQKGIVYLVRMQNFTKKLAFLFPRLTRVSACQGVRNYNFSETFAYVPLNDWSQKTGLCWTDSMSWDQLTSLSCDCARDDKRLENGLSGSYFIKTAIIKQV